MVVWHPTSHAVVIIKNRFRGDAHDTGYRDLNVVVAFEGFLCEIQVLEMYDCMECGVVNMSVGRSVVMLLWFHQFTKHCTLNEFHMAFPF